MKVQKILENKEVIKKASIFILLISFIMVYYQNNIAHQTYQLQYELINTKDMAPVEVAEKKETERSEKAVEQAVETVKKATDKK